MAAAPRVAIPRPDRPHHGLSIDFVSDSSMDGRLLRVLNVVDDCTRI